MSDRIRVLGLVAALGLCGGADLLACGEKFLVAGRGTRYQRPKNFRAASVLIYANPSSGLPSALGKMSVESVLKHEGHRSTMVETFEQLSAVLAAGRYDVILAASSVISKVKELLGTGPEAPAVVALCIKADGPATRQAAGASPCVKTPPRERPLLEAIDKAVEQRDRSVRRTQIGG